MQQAIVTLLSDFGLKDPYVAEMKAIILIKCPEAKIVDVSHEIDKFNIRMGAFILASATPYFPKGIVHVAVVDPGVGTKRRSIIVGTKHSHFVGPDNGLLCWPLQKKACGTSILLRIGNTCLRKLQKPFMAETFSRLLPPI